MANAMFCVRSCEMMPGDTACFFSLLARAGDAIVLLWNFLRLTEIISNASLRNPTSTYILKNYP